MIARLEEAHPSAQLTFTDIDGHRHQVFITDHPEPDICFLEGLYRGRGRCESAIRDSKDTGLANPPSPTFAINVARLLEVLIASDLLAWSKSLCFDGDLSHTEPKRLRQALLDTAGVIVRSGRHTTVRIADGRPWADELAAASGRPPSSPVVLRSKMPDGCHQVDVGLRVRALRDPLADARRRR